MPLLVSLKQNRPKSKMLNSKTKDFSTMSATEQAIEQFKADHYKARKAFNKKDGWPLFGFVYYKIGQIEKD